MIKGLRKGLTGLQAPTMIYADKDDHRIVLKGTYPIGAQRILNAHKTRSRRSTGKSTSLASNRPKQSTMIMAYLPLTTP